MNNTKKSSSLRIQITKQQIVTVDLKFPIFTLTVVENFIPAKAQDYLEKSSIDLSCILKKIEDSNYRPQTVLDFDHEEKHFSIWIE
jgi:hypothetical protein